MKILVSNGTGTFFALKAGMGLSCIICKVPVNFSSESLALVIQTSGAKNFGRSSKVRKKKKPGQVSQMVSALGSSSNNLVGTLERIEARFTDNFRRKSILFTDVTFKNDNNLLREVCGLSLKSWFLRVDL